MLNFMRRMFGSDDHSGERNPWSGDYWFTQIGTPTASGVRVTPERALQCEIVFACVKVISESIAQLPLHVYARLPNGDKRRADEHPLSELLAYQPNPQHTALEFFEQGMAHLLLRGNAYAEISFDARGIMEHLLPVHPDYCEPVRGVDGDWQYEIKEPGKPVRRRFREEMLHVRGLMSGRDSPLGMSPIDAARHSIGAQIAATEYAGRFWANDARPGGIIKHPGHFKDKDSKTNFIRAWQSALTGGNRHKVNVLEHGMEYQETRLTNEQSQFLETRKYQNEDIARIFRLQPHKVGINEHSTFSNIEHQGLEFVTDTLLPWLKRWEQAIRRDLIVKHQRPLIFAEFNVDGLLRGDIESRYRAYAIGRNWGWLSVNEVRAKENLNGIGEEGDVYLQPLNMQPAGEPEEPSEQNASRRALRAPPKRGGLILEPPRNVRSEADQREMTAAARIAETRERESTRETVH